MSNKLRVHVGNKILTALKSDLKISPIILKSLIQIPSVQAFEGKFAKLHISLNELQKYVGIPNTNDILDIKPDSIISKISLDRDRANRKISFDIKTDIFIKDVLENINIPDKDPIRKKVIVEFSSPNIAKPFHIGHLRSTIIGNFISKINEFLGNNVIKLNYLGDWGTQFGFVKIGVDLAKLTDEQIKANPLESLYSAYVNANKLAETDPRIGIQARKIFNDLEKGTLQDIDRWKTFSIYSIIELKKMYERLGVQFDLYHFESMYSAKEMGEIINVMKKFKVLQNDADGKQITIINNQKIPLIKSDGSMLYLTRDIAAAIDRYNKNKFDQMLYVVDNSQSDHFNNLQNILYKIDLPWAGRLKHVKFGRIRGMSTRKGTSIFLKDILDEAHDLMQQTQLKSPTTKVSINDKKTTDVLGITSIIIYDLKQRRQKDYDFDWTKALQVQGDTGIRLQYTHCRLCSLEKVNNIKPARECNSSHLQEPEVIHLVIHLARFNDVLRRAHTELEACLLVVYLFHLCNYINKALKVLRVKDQDPDIAAQRMLLFTVSKNLLGQGMQILGLQPLREM